MADSSRNDTDPQSRPEAADPEAEDGWFSWLRGALGRRPQNAARMTLADMLTLIDEDALPAEERAMLRNILAVRAKRVDDVMVPRADIIAAEQGTSLGDFLTAFREAGHSRLPIFRETLDDPVAMVHIKDLMSYLLSGAALAPDDAEAPPRHDPLRHLARVDFSRPISSVKVSRPVLFVPPSMPALDLLAQMQSTRVHMALVIDEYGGTDGLVTIEDLIEEVVGDIEDEHDFDEAPMIVERDEGGFTVDARADLDEVSDRIGFNLELGEEAEEVDTIGGLVVMLAGRVPATGEIIQGPGGYEFEIVAADPRRLKRIVLRRAQDAAAARDESTLPASPPSGGEQGRGDVPRRAANG